MAHPVTWFQISGKDGAALEAFYKEVFGWSMTPSPDGTMHMVDAEEGGIPGAIGASRDGAHSVTVYMNCDDIAAQLKKIQDVGGEVAMPPMELPEGMGWIAGFTDPAGNWVGLWQPSAQATPPAVKKAATKKAPAKKKAGTKKAPAPVKKAAPKAAKKAPKAAARAKKAPAPVKKAGKPGSSNNKKKSGRSKR